MSGISALGGMSQGMMRTFAPPSFSSLDSNSDGGMTLEELQSNAPGGVSDAQSQTRAAEMFSRMDSDSDGTVTSAEKDTFDAELQDRMSQMQFSTQMLASTGSADKSGANSLVSDILAALDGNSDGSVSASEFGSSDAVSGLDSSEADQLFSALDSDGSGSVSEDEISSFLEDNMPAGPPAGGPPMGGPPMGAGGQSSSSSEESSDSSSTTYDVLDTNEDGTVSLEERLAGIVNSSQDSTTSSVLDLLSAALSAYSSKSSSSAGSYLSAFFQPVDAEA